MTKCRYCGDKTEGRMYCSAACSSAFHVRKRGQQLVKDIMTNPRKVLDAIPVKTKQDLTKLDAITQRIEQKYFFVEEELPSIISLRLDTEEAKILNYIIKNLELPKENVLKIGMLALFRRVRELENTQTKEMEKCLTVQNLNAN